MTNEEIAVIVTVEVQGEDIFWFLSQQSKNYGHNSLIVGNK